MRKALDSWDFPDSGAQVALISPVLVKAMGGEGLVKKASLQIKDAGNHLMYTTGAVFVVISHREEVTGLVTKTHQMAYISSSVEDVVLSCKAMESLKIGANLDDRKKKNGSPRRIIDYQNLNNAVPCHTNITQSPFMCVSACPPRKKKSILDAKDGYHSVPLKKGERQAVTEFICEFGCYRCIGSGQGLICSGDAYTHRFDNITSQFINVFSFFLQMW